MMQDLAGEQNEKEDGRRYKYEAARWDIHLLYSHFLTVMQQMAAVCDWPVQSLFREK